MLEEALDPLITEEVESRRDEFGNAIINEEVLTTPELFEIGSITDFRRGGEKEEDQESDLTHLEQFPVNHFKICIKSLNTACIIV